MTGYRVGDCHPTVDARTYNRRRSEYKWDHHKAATTPRRQYAEKVHSEPVPRDLPVEIANMNSKRRWI